ncbi:MAG: response regulator [Candidatus Obscuribacterales bacterium]
MNRSSPAIILIEDEMPMRRYLRKILRGDGYLVIEAGTGEEGIRKAGQSGAALVILDLCLPDMDGLEVLKHIREWSETPVVILSAQNDENRKVEALNEGADDYLVKPFGSAELLARIRAMLRRSTSDGAGDDRTCIEIGPLRIDQTSRKVFLKDQEISLTPTEYRLFTVLLKNRGRVLTHDQLLEEIWGKRAEDKIQYLRVYMSELRKKLEENPAKPRYFVTEPGVGYRLRVD